MSIWIILLDLNNEDLPFPDAQIIFTIVIILFNSFTEATYTKSEFLARTNKYLNKEEIKKQIKKIYPIKEMKKLYGDWKEEYVDGELKRDR
jgi:hypothetical protein